MFSRTQRAPARQVPQVGREEDDARASCPASASKSERSGGRYRGSGRRRRQPSSEARLASSLAAAACEGERGEERSSAASRRGHRRGAVERVERRADRHALADEDRRVALGVAGRLALAQGQHQVHEVGRLVALERGHELLVVDPERVGRVVVDRLELAADPDVLVHRALPVLERKRVPGPDLHERIDDEVRRALRDDLARPAGLRVRRGLRRGEVGVGRLEPAGERRRRSAPRRARRGRRSAR